MDVVIDCGHDVNVDANIFPNRVFIRSTTVSYVPNRTKEGLAKLLKIF